MKDSNRRSYEACKRDVQFSVDHATGIPAGSAFAQLFTDLTAKVANIESKAGAQMFAKGEASEGFDLKEISREDLRSKCGDIADAADAAERLNPGIQAVFFFRRNMNDADLLATARAFILAAADWESVIKNYGLGGSWVADLTALADAFQASISQADSGIEGRAASVAEINQEVSEAMQIKRDLDKLVPIYFGDDPGAMAAWHTATHVERPPKKKPKP